MKLVAYMGILLLALIGFLAWQRMPRKVVFEIVHLSVWVFALGSFASLWAIDHLAPSMLDTLIPFVPPIIPVVSFVAWSMRRISRQKTAA